VFPSDQIADVGVNLSMYFKLFGREITFEVAYSNLCEKHS